MTQLLGILVFATKTAITAQSPMMKEEKSKSLVGDEKAHRS